ncbi:CLUMA_CG006533, isoform A [Clunio marinus]|uniref:CLUMA_CG006533, isoform A n=1 Tax=Clunio marinus TaxID=568069 RepID=A0A1J1I0A5_9DIPT|nr:CLUMA_CG006533, isoform A [Clunio marinus]
MGILSDPSISTSEKKSKYVNIVRKYSNSFCFMLYLSGVLWFSALSFNKLQSKTYFSENALLPGLVLSEIKMDSAHLARTLLQELEHERLTHKSEMPYSYLLAKMKQIGLETHIHNFTLNFPFGGGKSFKGKNIYGILRAPRTASTEAIVLSIPYRPPNSAHISITPTVPLLLAFAEFARRQKYWSKDLIFVVTDQEQLGMQAFLEAYFGEENPNILNSGTLNGRAGNIIAAINFEIQDFEVDFNNLKIEGLNGQLPNLDLHNLVVKLSHKQGISTGYKMKPSDHNPEDSIENLKNLFSMMWTQSSGVPNGNHGLFHRYGIEALTIESVKKESSVPNHNTQHKIMALLKIVEGISRSLNNLLERFHQSFFFYVIVSSDRFVSIGDYMPSIGMMAGSLLIKSFILWLISSESDDDKDSKEVSKSEEEFKVIMVRKSERSIDVLKVGKVFLFAHFVGVFALFITKSKQIHDYFHILNIATQNGIFYLILFVFILSLIAPKFFSIKFLDGQFLNIILLLELGTTLLAVAMLNFSLGFFLCLIIVPVNIVMNIQNRNTINLFTFIMKGFIHLLVHPLTIIYVVVFTMSYSSFAEMSLSYIFDKSLKATLDGITYSVVDSLVSLNLYLFGGNQVKTGSYQTSHPIAFGNWILNSL